MNHRQKNCTHCGEATHPQPQDPNHDTGYGHCYSCLNKKSWYVQNHQRPHLFIWEERPTNNGELSSDDSHGKVIELFFQDELITHTTTYLTISEIKKWAEARIKKLEAQKVEDLFNI